MTTRKEFMSMPPTSDSERTKQFNNYMSQFVTPGIISYVVHVIGEERIKASVDPYFNDIPLHRWDVMAHAINAMAKTRIRELGENMSLATGVCIGKQAARMWRDANKSA